MLRTESPLSEERRLDHEGMDMCLMEGLVAKAVLKCLSGRSTMKCCYTRVYNNVVHECCLA